MKSKTARKNQAAAKDIEAKHKPQDKPSRRHGQEESIPMSKNNGKEREQHVSQPKHVVSQMAPA